MSALGRLVASVVLDTAEFTGGADKAKYQAAQLASHVDRTMGDIERKAKGAMVGVGAALAAGFGVAAIKSWIEETVRANAALDDMAEKTGASVEQLSGMVNVAKVGGHDVGLLEASMAKLAKGMVNADDETKGAGKALEFLGISATDANGKLKNAGDLTLEIAKKFSEYADGAGKAAIAQTLFGKSGAQLLPYLKDLAEGQDNVVKVTAKQAAEAEALEKNIRRLAIAKGDLARTIAQEAIPVLNTVAEMYLKTKTAADGTLASTQALAANGSLRDWFEKLAYGAAFAVDSVGALITATKALGEVIAATARMAPAMLDLTGALAQGNGAAAYAAWEKIKFIQAEASDRLKTILESHKSIRFELDAQLKLARLVSQAESGAYADQNDRRAGGAAKRPGLEWTGDSSAKMAKAKSDLADIDKLLNQIFDKEVGLDGDFAEKMTKLWMAFATGRISLVDYTVAQAALIKQQPFMKKAIDEEAKARDELHKAYVQNLKDMEAHERIFSDYQAAGSGFADQMEFEISLIGKNAQEVAKLTEFRRLDLEMRKAIAALPEDASSADIQRIIDLNARMKERAGILIDQKGQLEQQGQIWGQLADRAGSFFADLAMNGRSAFDRLRGDLKSFAQEILALFAKRWVLQMVAGLTGSTSLAASAASAGAGSPAGSLLSWLGSAASGSGWLNTATGGLTGGMQAGWIGSPYAGAGPMADFGSFLGANALQGVGGGLAGYFGARALGAGQRGQAVGGGSGAALAMIGNVLMPGVGAVLGALAGAVIGKLTDPNGLAQRKGWFGDSSLGGDTRTRGSSVFGGFGITKSEWFGDDMIAKLSEFFKGLGTIEDSIAKYLSPDEIKRIQDAFAGQSKKYDFGIEHGDFSGTLGQMLKDRIDTIFNVIDPSLKKWLDGFQGTGEELAAYALDLLHVRDMLGDGSFEEVLKAIPDLTIEGLMKMQQAGETLSQTFTRVVNEFLAAQANLNAAIASRNPTFARELVLNNRNAIAKQFLDSLGMQFVESNLARMALNPQSFSGLNTQQMNWLAQFLNFQTELERLDQTIATGTGNVTVSLGNFGNALDNTAEAMMSAKGNLVGYLNGLNQSGLSPFNAQQRYGMASTTFWQQLALAEGGNLEALQGIQGYHQQFLQASQGYNASSPAYVADYLSSYARLNALTGNAAIQPLTVAAYQQATQVTNQLLTRLMDDSTQQRQLLVQLVNAVDAEEGLKTNNPELATAVERLAVAVGTPGAL